MSATIDELVGYAKANVEAARTTDEQQTWAAHHRHALAAKAEIERLRAALTQIDNETADDAIAKIAQDALDDEQSQDGKP